MRSASKRTSPSTPSSGRGPIVISAHASVAHSDTPTTMPAMVKRTRATPASIRPSVSLGRPKRNVPASSGPSESDGEVRADDGVRAEILDVAIDRTDEPAADAAADTNVRVVETERVLEDEASRARGCVAARIGTRDAQERGAHADHRV